MTTEPTDKPRETRERIWVWTVGPREYHDSKTADSDVEYVRSDVLASRDAEVREVLEGLSHVLKFKNGPDQRCWCNNNWTHSPACLATQTLWNKVRE